MKRFTNGKLLDKDIAQENLDFDAWQKPVPKESPQTIRNISRIEQLEAGEADLKKKLRQVYQHLNYLASSQWVTTKSQLPTPHLSWQEVSKAVFEFDEDITFWEQAQLAIQPLEAAVEQIVPPYYEKLSTVTKLFADLEEDFDDIPRRIVRCELLEKELAALEDSLEDEETEHFGWCVSLIRDVLDYNYAEKFTEAHLGLLKKGIDLISDKGARCNKEDYQNLHKEFLQSGLALIPTTQKAIDKYGD